MADKIPFSNLERQYLSIKTEIFQAIEQVLSSRDYIQGPFVKLFEQQFSAQYKFPNVIGCSNGTSAISIALEALGIGCGQEVIVPTHTFIATAEAVRHVGAKPVFIDIKPDTYCLDPDQIESLITTKTTAILPVHIYGNACDLDSILKIAQKHQLKVLEDCAQAHAASYQQKSLGSFGDAGCFSFYPGKNLGAYGDAGAIVTASDQTAQIIRKLIDHGRSKKYEHEMLGYNHRMDGIQGAILSVKLKYLSKWTDHRIKIASLYENRLKKLGLKTLTPETGCAPVYHLFVIELDNRDKIISELEKFGISSGVHYPIPLHLQPAFKYLDLKKGSFPVAEAAANKLLSLPICGEITEQEANYVCDCLEKLL